MAESYWSAIKNILATYVGKGLVSPVKAMSQGFAAETAGRAGAPAALQQQVGQAAVAPIAAAGQKVGETFVAGVTKPAEIIRADRAFDLGMREVDKFYQWAYPKVSQPLATAILSEADLVAGRSLDIAKNWKLAAPVSAEERKAGVPAGVSPGQALISNVVQFIDPHFNIADPADRKKTFEKNIFGKYSSGLLDGALMWYADPLVWVGKGAKVARETKLIQPIQSAEDVIRVRSELDSHGAYLASNGVIGRETPMGVVAERLTGKTAAEALDDIFVRRSNDPYLLSSLVGEAKTYEDTANFIAAAAGDKASLAKIAVSRASVADEIERSQNLLDSMQKKYLNIEWGSLKSVEASQPTIQEYDRLTNVLEDLKLRDENLSKAMTQNLGDYRIVNEYTSAADVNLFNKNIGVAIEKARAKASELRHDFTFYTETFQKSPYTRPVAVIQAAFNKLPRGLVRIDGGGLADSGKEIKYALNSVKPLRSAEFIGVKNELYREYANARNATERLAAVQHIESEIADIIALERGLTIEEARRWYGAYASVRRGMMDTFTRYGFWVDEGTGALVTSPFWKSEMPNVVPMMDFKDFDNFLSIYQKTRPIGVPVTKAALKSRAAVNEVGDMLDFANSLFKASVLTRMGYPVRNTVDGQLRALLTLNTLAKSDDVIKNLTKNAKTRIKQAAEFVDETVTLSNPAQLRDQIGKLVTQRSQVVDVRNSILDEITSKQYYAGAAGTFGKQVSPGEIELAISSKTKPLLKDRERNTYFELIVKQKQQKGLLFGDDREKLKKLQSKAYGKYVREEIVPTLPKGTTLAYLDFPSGKVFYKIPGKTGRIPSAAIPEIEARKGLPSATLANELEMNGLINVRGKGPIEHPDIRVITDYDVARGNNFEEIASLLGEDYMYRVNHYQKMIDDYDMQILEKVNQSQELAKIRAELKIVKSGETDVKQIGRAHV